MRSLILTFSLLFAIFFSANAAPGTTSSTRRATTTSSAPAPTGTASNPFYLYVVNPLNGLRYYLRMNSVGYLVALCPPAPVNVETFAAVFSILGDGSLFTSGSVVDPTAQFAKVPQEQGAPVNGSDLYNYFRFGPDNKVSPTNPNGFTETTFVNGSGTLDWQNVKFNNVVNTGHATFGLNPSATNHIGWIDIIFYGTDTLPGTSSPILLQIQDVGSIPPPTFSCPTSSSSSMASTPSSTAPSITPSVTPSASPSASPSPSPSASPSVSSSLSTSPPDIGKTSSTHFTSPSAGPWPTSTSPAPTCAVLSLPTNYFTAPPAGAICVSYTVIYISGVPSIVTASPGPTSSVIVMEP